MAKRYLSRQLAAAGIRTILGKYLIKYVVYLMLSMNPNLGVSNNNYIFCVFLTDDTKINFSIEILFGSFLHF